MDVQGVGFYLSLIEKAQSYHDLVIVRSRYFSLMDRTLTKDECQAVKDRWHAKARDENLPIAPPKGAPSDSDA